MSYLLAALGCVSTSLGGVSSAILLKPAKTVLVPGDEPHRIAVKFREGLNVRLRNNVLVSANPQLLASSRPLLDTLSAATLCFAGSEYPSGTRLRWVITTAVSQLRPGGIRLIEQSYYGPNMTQDVIDQGGQYGTVPVECFRPIYHAIGLAVGQGIIVIEPAANGGQNLDAPIYRIGNGGHWPFLPKINLGAIMVGAGVSFDGSSAERSRLGFSNYSELLTLKRHTSAVGGVALSPDGNRLASASADGTVKVWDATPRSEASAPEAKTR